MCGISGIINFNGLHAESQNEIRKITSALAHRGPDNEDFFSSPMVCFGHRRLSIIDLSEDANQPMQADSGNVIITFNGEIFNHEEIRNLLSSKYKFETDHSDTEVILHAYKEWGIDCIKRFTGQFAFAIYDKERQEVFLARDRIGQKPLYYSENENGLYFASEINALFKSGCFKKSINPNAVYDYLTYLTIKAPETFFNGISKLEPGHYIHITQDKIETFKYWDIADSLNTVSTDTEEKATLATEDLLEKSMKYRNVSDGPISFALSGGLDSSLNIYYSKKINPDLHAINISYETDNQFNEDKIAKRFCSEEDIPFTSKKINSTILEDSIQEYLKIQYDVPIGDPNSVLMFILSNISKELKRNVLMVGEGGDEIGGYPKYLKHHKRYNLLKNTPNIFKKIFNNPFYDLRKLDLIQQGKIVSGAHVHGFTESEKLRFWNGDKVRSSYNILLETMDEIQTGTDDEFLRKILNLEYKIRLPEMILSRIDYPAMAASIEARSPFVDHKLIEYSCTLPFDVKMKSGVAKHIIKSIAGKKLPSYILKAPKVGFGQLLTPFLNDTLPIWYKTQIIDTKDAPIKEFVDSNFLNSIYKKIKKGKNVGFKMWVLFALNYWLVANKDTE